MQLIIASTDAPNHNLAGGPLQLIRRLRISAIFCALAVLVCELIARPYANMSLCDDGPYILMAHNLATTGHIAYNGWAAPMLGWQLYLGAAFIKLFGYSFTAVRSSTIFVAMVIAFILQRTLALAGITERNATLGTLAFVLSPLYLMLSVTYMTDIFGLFAIVVCLYGCLRALQSSSDRGAIGWLCFAVVTNAVGGTSRQIAWLGVLVMVPSTLWLMRSKRRVVLAGAAATLAGALFIFACMQWLKHQPYSIAEHLIPSTFPVGHTIREFAYIFLEVPLLLLPIVVLFLLEFRKRSPRIIAINSAVLLGYLFLATHPAHRIRNLRSFLEPTLGDWFSVSGIFQIFLPGNSPVFLPMGARVFLTILSIGGTLGIIVVLLRHRSAPLPMSSRPVVSWKQLGVVLAPFTIAYLLLLVPRATEWLNDRYLLGLLVVPLLCLVRYYQEQIQPRLPVAGVLLVAIMAIYGIAVTHNVFALFRARTDLAAELRSYGIPDTSVDNGWEYNLDVELQHSNHLNDHGIVVPANAYVPNPQPAGLCQSYLYDDTPHIHPLYAVSFDPNACYGPAHFPPVHYSRWLASAPGTLYVVRYTQNAKP